MAAFATVLVCSMAIAVHHTGVTTGDTHGEMDMTATVEMYLGAFTAVGAAVLAVALGWFSLGSWRPTRCLAPTAAWWGARAPVPRAAQDLRFSPCTASAGADRQLIRRRH